MNFEKIFQVQQDFINKGKNIIFVLQRPILWRIYHQNCKVEEFES